MLSFLNRNYITFLGLICLLALLVLSLYFYRERIYFSDPAYQLFLLINDQKIEIMTNRWPSTIFRALPFLGLKLGWSSSTLAKLFSLSFPLFHIICFSILSFKLKDKALSLLALFSLLLITNDSFYWCSSDLLQGILTLLLGISLFRNTQSIWTKYFLSSLLMVAAVFFHPLCLFPLFYIIIDDSLQQRALWKPQWVLALVFGSTWFVRNKFFSTWYDQAKGTEFWNNFDNLDWFTIPTHKTFLTHELLVFYPLLILIVLLSILILFRKKAWLRILFLVVSLVGFTLLVHISNPQNTWMFYRESNYVCLALFVSYPFVKHICSSALKFKYKIVLPLILGFCILRIGYRHHEFTERINFISEQIAASKCAKTILEENEAWDPILKMEWAIPFESLLIANEIGNDKTIFYSKKNKALEVKERTDVFLSPFKILYTSDFNKEYFDFENSYYCKDD